MNNVIMTGNLVKNPSLKNVGDKSLTQFTIAVNDGNAVLYLDVDTWDKTADNCQKFLTKGSKVLVNGRLKQESWEKDGVKKTRFKLIANMVEFLSSKPQQTTESNSEESDIPNEENDSNPPF